MGAAEADLGEQAAATAGGERPDLAVDRDFPALGGRDVGGPVVVDHRDEPGGAAESQSPAVERQALVAHPDRLVPAGEVKLQAGSERRAMEAARRCAGFGGAYGIGGRSSRAPHQVPQLAVELADQL